MSEPKKGKACSFSEAMASLIVELAANGSLDEEIADQVGIHVNTLRNWRKRFPTFDEQVRAAKDLADEAVVASLFKRATGYKRRVVKVFQTKFGEIHREEYDEEVPPDPTSCIFWLKNRRREEWRDVHKVELEKKVTVELPSPQDAVRILQEDYATLPAKDVKVEDL